MEKRIAKLESTIALLIDYVQQVNKTISGGLNKSDKNFDKITINLKRVQGDLAIINAKIDKLEGHTSNSLKKVDVKLDDLKTEIKKINSVTGYDDLFQNLKVVSSKK